MRKPKKSSGNTPRIRVAALAILATALGASLLFRNSDGGHKAHHTADKPSRLEPKMPPFEAPQTELPPALQPSQPLSSDELPGTDGTLARRTLFRTDTPFGTVLMVEEPGQRTAYYSVERIPITPADESHSEEILADLAREGIAASRPFEFSPLLIAESEASDPSEVFRGLDEVRSAVGSRGIVELDRIGFSCAVVPNDPYFPRQWHHVNIESSKAWELERGSEEIVVAVLDSGVYPDLVEFEGRLVPGVNINYQFDLDDYPEPIDYNSKGGHGTLVTGVIAANTNNGQLLSGIDWNCKIMPVKTVFSGASTTARMVPGMDYAVGHGARVINISWGDGPSDSLLAATERAAAAGCVVVASMGNNGSDLVNYPAVASQALAVGSTAEDDSRADFSNYGDHIDLVAPGVNMLLLDEENRLKPTPLSGTSASAPMVAAAAAMVLSVNPDLDWEGVKAFLAAGAEDQVGDALDTPGWDPHYGWGRLNIYNTLLLVRPPEPELTAVQGGTLLRWPAPTNVEGRARYHIEYSTKLRDWTEVEDPKIELAQGQAQWLDPLASEQTSESKRFYRLWTEPLIGFE